jgi:glutaredoxin
MKDVLMFITAWCPYCQKALAMIDQVRDENDAYKDVAITIIDEEKEKKYADQFDYWRVPTFYVDGVKVHEGAATLDCIRNVFKKAVEQG